MSSRFDKIYRKLLLTKFFTKGWGQPENLKRIFEFRKTISNRETCRHLVPEDYPIYIDKDQLVNDVRIIEGHFTSPLTKHVPGIMPKEVETANFQMILPKEWNTKWKTKSLKPVCLQLAGTGDHGFWRRRTLLARPLLKEAGIASILLENPYYGMRKPKSQLRSSLHNVSDLLVMGGALVLESLALFHWCERQGYGPLGITGISMGGHMASAACTNWHKPLSLVPCLSWTTASLCFTQMASLAATNWCKPLALVPCLSWSTASVVFTQGVMSEAIPWKVLEAQYMADSVYSGDLSKMVHSPEDDLNNSQAFQMGQHFAKTYPESLEEMQKIYDDHSEILRKKQLESICNRNTSINNLTGANLNIVPTSTQSDQEDVDEHVAKPTRHGSAGFEQPSNTFAVGGHMDPNSRPYSTKSQNNNLMYKAKSLLHWQQKSTKDDQNSSSSKTVLAKKRGSALQKESLDFMRGVMDECTHLGNFSVPLDPELIIIVAAKGDAYVPRDRVLKLDEIWPGSEVRYIDSGHVAACVFKQDVFRKAIIDSFDRQIQKYHS